MIKFCCQNCGQKISVQDAHAGKQGKCPKCKNTVIIPKQAELLQPAPSTKTINITCSMCNQQIQLPESSEGNLVECPHCNCYVEVILEKIPIPNIDTPIEQRKREAISKEYLQAAQKTQKDIAEQTEPTGKRTLPWFIDALLYPANLNGVIYIGIFLVLHIVVRLLGRFVSLVAGHYHLGAILPLILLTLLIGYICYYFGYCILDSAKGGWRAPGISIQDAPDKADLFWDVLTILGSIAICYWPAAVYYIFAKQTNPRFWVLLAAGTFFFPMALLTGMLFESFEGLNPILIIRSILRTFFSYCGLEQFKFSCTVFRYGMHEYISYRIKTACCRRS